MNRTIIRISLTKIRKVISVKNISWWIFLTCIVNVFVTSKWKTKWFLPHHHRNDNIWLITLFLFDWVSHAFKMTTFKGSIQFRIIRNVSCLQHPVCQINAESARMVFITCELTVSASSIKKIHSAKEGLLGGLAHAQEEQRGSLSGLQL